MSIKQDGLQIKYCGETVEATASERRTTIIYQGTESSCRNFYDGLQVTDVDTEHGTLKGKKLYQDSGPFWNVELTYLVTLTSSGSFSTGSGYGPHQSTLNCRMMTMPLENRPNYKAKWNHYLFSANGDVPNFWENASNTNLSVDQRQYYKWGSSASECPDNWAQVKRPTKPGVDGYYFPTYEITEQCKVGNMNQAGFLLHHQAQRVGTPENGDFGIKRAFGGNWLCEGGSVSYDGDYYVVSLTYLYSPDKWDDDLYSD